MVDNLSASSFRPAQFRPIVPKEKAEEIAKDNGNDEIDTLQEKQKLVSLIRTEEAASGITPRTDLPSPENEAELDNYLRGYYVNNMDIFNANPNPVPPEEPEPEEENASIEAAGAIPVPGEANEDDFKVEIYAYYQLDYNGSPTLSVKDGNGNIISPDVGSAEGLAIKGLQESFAEEIGNNFEQNGVEGVLIKGKNGGLIAVEISQGTEGLFRVKDFHAEAILLEKIGVAVGTMFDNYFSISPEHKRLQAIASLEGRLAENLSWQASVEISPNLIYLKGTTNVITSDDQKFGDEGVSIDMGRPPNAGGTFRLLFNSEHINSRTTVAFEKYKDIYRMESNGNAVVREGFKSGVDETFSIGSISLGSYGTLEIVVDANFFIQTINPTEGINVNGTKIGGSGSGKIIWSLPVGNNGSSFRFGLGGSAGGTILNNKNDTGAIPINDISTTVFTLNPSFEAILGESGVSLFLNGDVIFRKDTVSISYPDVEVNPDYTYTDVTRTMTGENSRINTSVAVGVKLDETALSAIGRGIKNIWDKSLGGFISLISRRLERPTSQIDAGRN